MIEASSSVPARSEPVNPPKTPRTDAVVFEFSNALGSIDNIVDADFARALEHEADTLRIALIALRDLKISDMPRKFDAALAWIQNDSLVKKMVEDALSVGKNAAAKGAE